MRHLALASLLLAAGHATAQQTLPPRSETTDPTSDKAADAKLEARKAERFRVVRDQELKRRYDALQDTVVTTDQPGTLPPRAEVFPDQPTDATLEQRKVESFRVMRDQQLKRRADALRGAVITTDQPGTLPPRPELVPDQPADQALEARKVDRLQSARAIEVKRLVDAERLAEVTTDQPATLPARPEVVPDQPADPNSDPRKVERLRSAQAAEVKRRLDAQIAADDAAKKQTAERDALRKVVADDLARFNPVVQTDTMPITINYTGGELAEFTHMVQEVAGQQISIVISPSASRLEVGPLNLMQVSPEVALRAAAVALVDDGPHINVQSIGPKTFAIEYVPATKYDHSSAPNRTHIFDLAPLVHPSAPGMAGMAPEVVLSAVEAALSADPTRHDETHIVYHKESGLLIGTGREDRLEVIREVLENLGPKREQQYRDSRLRAKDEAAADPAAFKKLQAEHAELTAHFQAVQDESRAVQDKLLADMSASRKYQEQSADLSARLRAMEEQYKHLQAQYDEAQAAYRKLKDESRANSSR